MNQKAYRSRKRFRCVVLAGLFLAASSAVQSNTSAAGGAQRSLGITIVIPPHCFELIQEDAGEEQLRDVLHRKRLLCQLKRGDGQLKRIERDGENLRVVPGEPNTLHRAGLL